MNGREEILARIAEAHRAAPPPNLRYEDISREYRTTSDSSTEVLTELLIDRLVDYRALVRQCSEDDLGAKPGPLRRPMVNTPHRRPLACAAVG